MAITFGIIGGLIHMWISSSYMKQLREPEVFECREVAKRFRSRSGAVSTVTMSAVEAAIPPCETAPVVEPSGSSNTVQLNAGAGM